MKRHLFFVAIVVVVILAVVLVVRSVGVYETEEPAGQNNAQRTESLSEASENVPAEQKIRQAQALLKDAKQELAAEGKYACCIKDPCDRCALDHQSCPCADDLKKGKAVCSECVAGWQRGDGTIEGIDPKKVTGSSHRHSH